MSGQEGGCLTGSWHSNSSLRSPRIRIFVTKEIALKQEEQASMFSMQTRLHVSFADAIVVDH